MGSMLSYQLQGAGPPLLLIHGFGISYPIWRTLAPLLVPHFQLVMVELPGIGQSPPAGPDQPYVESCAQALQQLRLALGYTRWSVFSYSSGTRAAEAYVRRDAVHVERVIFLCPAYSTGWRWQALQLLSQVDARMPSFGTWVLSGWRLAGLVQLLGFNGRRLPAVGEWTGEIAAQPVDTLRSTLRSIPRPSEELFRLPAPALYIWGDRDVVFPRPRRFGKDANDYLIRADHSAPQFAAQAIAEIAIPFLQNRNADDAD
jgi:pimeloyl-ACP methyl ester carboxylesterase